MKFFAVAFVAVFIAVAAASPAANAKEAENSEAESANTNVGAPVELTRLRKSAYGAPAGGSYGGATIPAPPCPKNYLFSCQPNLAPVACAPPSSGGYGSSGAYSAPVPTYITPNNYYPAYAPQPIAYPNFYQY